MGCLPCLRRQAFQVQWDSSGRSLKRRPVRWRDLVSAPPTLVSGSVLSPRSGRCLAPAGYLRLSWCRTGGAWWWIDLTSSRWNRSSRAGEVGVEEFHRGLKERHIQMIAIGGAIGVGLFLGSAILGTLMILPRA